MKDRSLRSLYLVRGRNRGNPLADSVQEPEQLYLFPKKSIKNLDPGLWHGSYNARESSLQQLSPYVGKMKSGMARVLIELYSTPGQTVLDPFSGSGVVPLEAVLAGRCAWANDLSPYAYVLTRGKLEAPVNSREAMAKAWGLAKAVSREAGSVELEAVPQWVREFYHPRTLCEILTAFRILEEQDEYFLRACLLGILHHVRPGFLSYPASHLVPYLRKDKYPREQFPDMYVYRDLASRLFAKVKRAYRRCMFPVNWHERRYKVWKTNSMNLPIADGGVDCIISSPPYFGALDYARDNRLRLWFLGCHDWKQLDASLTANNKVYIPEMSVCLREMHRVLKKGAHCVLVLGDVQRQGKNHRTAEILADLARKVTDGGFHFCAICDDTIPDDRRSRRRTRTTKYERILVLRKE